MALAASIDRGDTAGIRWTEGTVHAYARGVVYGKHPKTGRPFHQSRAILK